MNNALIENNTYPKFISNSPCGEDLFEGKSQEKVADNIAHIIKDSNDCKIVGIDGSWGSGKSNLIEIIKRKLSIQDESSFYFFIYDAWGHQEDLQRRSLLEELTFFLTKKNDEGKSIIADSTKWEKKLKKLLAKSKETEKKTIPSLSLGIVFSGLVLILTPVFKAISEFSPNHYIKTIITSIPFLLLVFVFIYFYFKKTDSNEEFKVRINEAIAQLFHIYQKNQIEDITFETISEDEPSVKKFREWMSEISTDLNKDKLIIVFDNMDRLPAAKVLQLWSSIHTFFAENHYENIKVIIPFDRQNIQNAFKEQHRDQQTNYANDFINKTFNVVYRVSPPILSDWKKFFEIKWKNAFNTIDSPEEFQKVIQVFDHLTTSKTPREIVVFINEFVAIAQVSKDVPFRYISIFIICKEIILRDPDNEIIKGTYFKSLNFLYENDEDLPKYIASLVYQIEPDRAIEVIFAEKLTIALNNNLEEEILTLSDAPSFQDILEKSITSVENYENTILGLNCIQDKINEKTWNDLYLKLDKQVTNNNDAKIKEYQLIILKKVSRKETCLIEILFRLANSEKFVAVDYYNSIKELEKCLNENNINLALENFLPKKKTTSEDYLSLLKVNKGVGSYSMFCDNDELNQYLGTIESIDDQNNSEHLLYIPEDYDLSAFLSDLEDKIAEDPLDRPFLSARYQFYKNASRGQILKEILSDSNIYSLFTATTNFKEDFYYDLICMRIARLNAFSTSYTSYFEDVLAEVEPEFVTAINQHIGYFMNYGDMLLKLNTFPKPLFIEIVKSITINPIGIQRLSIVPVLKKFDKICEVSQIEIGILITRLNQWSSLPLKVIDINDLVQNTKLYEGLKIANNNLSSHCLKITNEYFDQLSIEKWIEQFQDKDSKLIQVSLNVIVDKYPAAAVSAIKDVLLKISKSEIEIPDKKTWNEIVGKSNKNAVEAVIKDICVLFINSIEINPELFAFFGQWIFEYEKLENYPTALRRIFRSEVLQNDQCLAIILDNKDAISKIYNSNEGKEDFSIEITALLNESKPLIQELSKIIGIKAKKKEKVEKKA